MWSETISWATFGPSRPRYSSSSAYILARREYEPAMRGWLSGFIPPLRAWSRNWWWFAEAMVACLVASCSLKCECEYSKSDRLPSASAHVVFQFMSMPTVIAFTALCGPSENTLAASETRVQVSMAMLFSSKGDKPSPSSVTPTALMTQVCLLYTSDAAD